jgi:hypothetical protein
METAEAHQRLAEQALAQLHAQLSGLDELIGAQIRHAFVEECGALVEEAARAHERLRALGRAAILRFSVLGALLLLLAGGAVLLGVRHLLPSTAELAGLRAERARLATSVQQLAARGGRVQLRRCGSNERLCVQIDRRAPPFGPAGDYLVLKGY